MAHTPPELFGYNFVPVKNLGALPARLLDFQ
jgi:hypothetical protein